MAFIGKIFLTIVALQLALVLAKPYEPYNVDLYNSNEPMDEYFHKREELGRRCLEWQLRFHFNNVTFSALEGSGAGDFTFLNFVHTPDCRNKLTKPLPDIYFQLL